MRKILTFVALGVLAIGFIGCRTGEISTLPKLKAERDSLWVEVVKLESVRDSLIHELRTLQARYSDLYEKYSELLLATKRPSAPSPPAPATIKKLPSPPSYLPYSGPYCASKKSKERVFHYCWCDHAKRIAPHNLIIFHTRDEAIQSGRRPCKVCKP